MTADLEDRSKRGGLFRLLIAAIILSFSTHISIASRRYGKPSVFAGTLSSRRISSAFVFTFILTTLSTALIMWVYFFLCRCQCCYHWQQYFYAPSNSSVSCTGVAVFPRSSFLPGSLFLPPVSDILPAAVSVPPPYPRPPHQRALAVIGCRMRTSSTLLSAPYLWNRPTRCHQQRCRLH